MTLVYDDLPVAEDGVKRTSLETDAWQAANAPIVSVRVWLGKDEAGGIKTLTRVTWSDDAKVADGVDPVCKPLEEMSAAMAALHSMVHQVETAITLAALQRVALDVATKH